MKAIIPIAGLGTRLLPLTKVIPKAMLPVAGKPSAQWIVEELAQAGVKDIIFVTSKGQEMVQEYFAKKTWYDEELQRRGKVEEAKKLEAIRNLARFHFVEQQDQLGDGHAILQTKKLIRDEPFLVIFGDCLYKGDDVIQKLLSSYKKTSSCIVAVQKISSEKAHLYGIAEVNKAAISTLIEKPSQEHFKLGARPLAIIGRYLFTPAIWPHLEKCLKTSGEARLIDALQSLLSNDESVSAVEVNGQWLDVGTLEGLWRAHDVLKPPSYSP